MNRYSSSPTRKVLAGSAVVALAVMSLAAGVSIASAAPGAPSITAPLDQDTTVATDILVSGTVVDFIDQVVTVEAHLDGVPAAGCSVTVSYLDSTFSCNLPLLVPGVYELTATSYELADIDQVPSPVSEAVTVIVGGTDSAVFTSPTGFNNVWTSAPTLVGTGPAFGSVEVQVITSSDLGETSSSYCSSAVDASGGWSCAGANTPPAGYAYFQAFGSDVTGTATGGPGFDDETGGDIVVPPTGEPDVDYVFGPASVAITITGQFESQVAGIVFSVTQGEGYQYMPIGYCPADAFAGPESPLQYGGDIETCAFSDLAPGIWNFYSVQSIGGVESDYRDDFVRIPEAPGSFGRTFIDGNVRFSGTGTPGYRAIVETSAGAPVCNAIVEATSQWQCTISRSSASANYRALQQSVGFVAEAAQLFEGADAAYDGFSPRTSSVVVAALPQGPSVPLTVGPLAWTLLGVGTGDLIPGQELDLSAEGLPPGTKVVVEIRSTPRVLGSATVGGDGLFQLAVTVPNDLEAGNHTIVATATPPGGTPSPVSIPVEVLADGAESVEAQDVAKSGGAASAAASQAAALAASGSSAGGSGSRDEPGAPSAISESIPTIDRVVRTPLLIAISGGLAFAILLLVAFPAELINSTLAQNTRRLGRWYAAIDSGVQRATEWFTAVTRTQAAAAAVLVVLTSLIFGFVDPDFGFDLVSLRMTFSLALGLFTVTYVASWISGSIIKRLWGIPTRVSLQPAALVFAIIGVIVARLLDFSPGFLIGLVIGLDLLTRVDAPNRVRAVLTNIGVIVSLAVLAWIGYSLMAAFSGGEPTFVGLLAGDALVATTSEGLTAALAALMPLGFLQGHEVFRRSKLLWAGVFTLVATLFALIVLPTASGEKGDPSQVGFWLMIMVAFAMVSLTLWALLQFSSRAERQAEEPIEHESLPVG